MFYCINNVGGWQFLTIEVAEILCMVCHQRNIFPENKDKLAYLDNRPFKKSRFIMV